MELSVLFLIVALSIVLFTQVIALLVQYRVDRTYNGINYWIVGTGLMAVGFLVMPLVAVKSIRVIAIISNPLLILGLLFLYVGMTKFLNKRVMKWIPILIFILFMVLYLYFFLINNNLSARTFIISATISLISFIIAWQLFSEKDKLLLITSNFAGVIFISYGGFYLLRSIATIISKPATNYDDQAYGLIMTMIVSIVVSNLWTYALIIMINQRLNVENQMEQEKLQLVFNTSIDAQLITRLVDGYIVDVNDEFTCLSGYSKIEVIGNYMDSGSYWNTLKDREVFIKEVTEKGFCENMEFTFRRKDESYFFGIVSAKIIMIHSVAHVISVVRDITQRKHIESKMQELVQQLEKEKNVAQHNAITDSLTGLYNRRYFDQILRTEFSRLMMPGKKLSLIMLDIDYFKKFNDIYGHLEGDSCLQLVATTLGNMVEGENGIVARFGGEEFIMVLPEMDENSAQELGEKSRKAIENLAIPHEKSKVSKQVTISAGVITIYPHELKSTDHALKLVDDALYLAKERGRNQCVIGNRV